METDPWIQLSPPNTGEEDTGGIAVETCTLYQLLLDLRKKPANQLELFQPIIIMLEQELDVRTKNTGITAENLCKEQLESQSQGGDIGTQVTPPTNQNTTSINLLGREFNVWQLGFFGLLAFILLKKL